MRLGPARHKIIRRPGTGEQQPGRLALGELPESLAKRLHGRAGHQEIQGEQGQPGGRSFRGAFDIQSGELLPAPLRGLAILLGPAVLAGIVGLAGREVGQP